MSRPRIPKAYLEQETPPTPPRSDYAAFPSSPRSRSPRKQGALPILYGPRGTTLSQRRFLPRPKGQIGLLERPATDEKDTANPVQDAAGLSGNPVIEDPFSFSSLPTPHRDKRLKQAHTWEFVVLPTLITPYLSYLRESKNMAQEVDVRSRPCTCMGTGARSLNLMVVRFASIEEITLDVCQCLPASLLLVERGLFGCAPLYPSLAVDFRMLDFVTRLFLRIAPNITAICNTVQDFLQAQGYPLRGKDPLRRRFSNSLRWYNMLQHIAGSKTDAVLDIARMTIRGETLSPASEPVGDDWDGLFGTEPDSSDTSDTEESEAKRARLAASATPPLTRPSDYLRTRCPLCFRGDGDFQDGISSIVCLDACFTQKHNKQPQDPRSQHPRSCFIPPEDVQRWQDLLEGLRPKRGASTSSKPEPEDDRIERGLKVPNSVLDACNESFTAADGDRMKASTQFFDSTALMALLCRHDRVLWLVNMTTPGERQQYAFVLLQTLFRNLPDWWTVGVLYDIACQTERSCHKWRFFDEFLPQITFAISVFHAFGHGWACQCIYHPRKRSGFGLSDGEGCKRLWHMLSPLIAYLRVCGHFTRLYTLDNQIQFINRSGTEALGSLLARQWNHANSKREEAEQDVQYSMRSPQFLREQWRLQVESSTKPLPRQSRAAGKKAIDAALRLRQSRDAITHSVKRLESVLAEPAAATYEVAEAEMDLPDLHAKLIRITNELHAKEVNLGVDGMKHYRHLTNSPFLRDRVNAKALKTRICQRLRARKFERDRLERSFRRQINTSERKLHNHVESTVKRRDSGIESLVHKYNKLCRSMADAITSNRAPRNSQAPRPINVKELFTLDVDDAIWDDSGLTNEDDTSNPPLWLCDEQVRTGIRGILLRDRCDEQLLRLKHELAALGHWFREEWAVVDLSLSQTQDLNILHQIRIKQRELVRVAMVWLHALSNLPAAVIPDFLGPAGEDLSAIRSEVDAEVRDTGVSNGEEENGYVELENDDLDPALVEHMDTLDIVDLRESRE